MQNTIGDSDRLPRLGAVALALREMQSRLAFLSEVSLQGVIAHRRFTPIHANQAVCSLLGYSTPEDLIGRASILDHFDLDVRVDPDRAWRRLSSGIPTLTRMTLLRADGSAFPADVFARAVPWSGEPAVLMAVIDVSRQERALRALIEARTQVEAAERARRKFLASASHDLRTPLHATMGRLQLMLDRDAQGGDPSLAREALNACRRLQQHIDDVLDAAAIETGAPAISNETFALRDALQEALDLFGIQEDGADRPLTLETPRNARLIGDPRRVRRIAFAMLEEGAARCARAPLTLTASVEPDGLTLWCRASQEGVVVRPADNPETRSIDGVALANALVAAMDGVLEIRDAPGSAWEMEVFVPLRSAVAANAPPRLERALDILVVEDNAANRGLLELVLRKLGHTAHLAAGGREALALSERRAFDFVIMDLSMPDLDGFETTRRLRAGSSPWMRNVPIVALTASGAPGVEEQAADAGMDAFLTKPLDIRRLAETLALLNPPTGDLVWPAELNHVEHEHEADEAENDRERRHAKVS